MNQIKESIPKKEWQKPEIIILDFKKTAGGAQPNEPEGSQYSASPGSQ